MADTIPVTEMQDQAENALATMNANYRQNSAYTAMRNMYGPALAGDPQGMLQVQGYNFNNQMEPLQLQNQQITNTGLQNQTNYLAQSYPLQLTGQDLENQGKAITNSTAQIANSSAGLTLAGQKAWQVHTALSAAINNLGVSLNGVTDPGTRTAIAQTELGRVAGQIGMDPNDPAQAAALQPYISAIAAQGAAALPAIQNDLDGTVMGGLSLADKGAFMKNLADTKLDAARTTQAQAETTGANAKALTDVGTQISALQAKEQGLGFIQNRTNLLLDQPGAAGQAPTPGLISKAQALIPQFAPNPLLRRARAEMPGTAEYQFEQLMDQVKPNAALEDLTNSAAQGLHLGRPAVAEFNGASTALTNADLGQDPAQISSSLGALKDGYQQLASGYNSQIQTLHQQRDALQTNYNGMLSTQAQPVQAGSPGATAGSQNAQPIPLAPQQPNATAAALPPNSPPALGQAITSATSDPAWQDYLVRTSGIESDFGRNQSTSSAGAQGAFQFIGKTAKQFGVTDPSDPAQEAQATLAYAAANAKVLQKAGITPTPADLYLAHNQGGDGAAKLLSSDPNKLAGSVVPMRNILQNGGNQNTTVGQFVKMFYDRYQAAGKYGSGAPLGSPQNPKPTGYLVPVGSAAPQPQQTALQNYLTQALGQMPAGPNAANAATATPATATPAAPASLLPPGSAPLAPSTAATYQPAGSPAPVAAPAPQPQVQPMSPGQMPGLTPGDKAGPTPPVKPLPWTQVLAQVKALQKKYGLPDLPTTGGQ